MLFFIELKTYKMVGRILALLLFSSVTQAFLHRDNNADLGGQAPINWTSCGGEAIGVNPLHLKNCDQSNCTLKMYKGYPGKFSMTPRYNHTYLNLYVASKSAYNGKSLTLLNTNGYEKDTYITGKTFFLNFPLIFGKYFQTNRTNDLHTITVKVGSQKLEVCRQFDVYVNSEVPNNMKEVGDACWAVGAPCDFEHSECAKSGNNATCKCDSLSVVRNKKCVKIIDVPCTADSDCLDHAECSNGYCRCKDGFKAHAKDKCSNSGSALAISVLLLGLSQIFANLQ